MNWSLNLLINREPGYSVHSAGEGQKEQVLPSAPSMGPAAATRGPLRPYPARRPECSRRDHWANTKVWYSFCLNFGCYYTWKFKWTLTCEFNDHLCIFSVVQRKKEKKIPKKITKPKTLKKKYKTLSSSSRPLALFWISRHLNICSLWLKFFVM